MGRNPGPKSWSSQGDQIEKIDGGDIGRIATMVAQHTAKQIVPTKEDKKSNIKSGLSKGQWNGENRIAKGNVWRWRMAGRK